MCIRESTNKSVFADAFPRCPAAAFANVELQSGGATALAFFLFPSLAPLAQIAICLVCAVLSVVRLPCYGMLAAATACLLPTVLAATSPPICFAWWVNEDARG